MKILQTILASILISVSLNAQVDDQSITHTFEWLFGMGKVNDVENGKYVYFVFDSPDYESEFITSAGVEFNSRISSNWTFYKKHEVLIGIDMNLWNRYSFVTAGDVLSNWRDTPGVPTSEFQTDLVLGYRYIFIEKKTSQVFLENAFYTKLFSGHDTAINYSIQFGIGARFNIGKGFNLISILNYKYPIGDYFYDQLYQNSYGIKLGLSKKM